MESTLKILFERIDDLIDKLSKLEFETNEISALKEKNKEYDEKFNLICQLIDEAVIITSTGNKIAVWNDAAEKLTGYSFSEAMGIEIETLLFSPFEKSKYEGFYLHTLEAGKNSSYKNYLDSYIVNKAGDDIPVKINVAFINSYPDKYVLHIFKTNEEFNTDGLSGKIKLDILLQNEIKELEKRAQNLIDEHDRLNRSENHLKKMNYEKDKFFSIIAHDLRAPFQSLLNSANTLKTELDELSKDEMKIFITNIGNSAKHVYRLVENLLDWARIQTGAIEKKPKTFNIKDLIMEVAYLYKNMAIEKKITFKLESQKGVDVYADENMVSTVLRNLVANALKFTRSNGTVTIRAEKESNFVRVEIEDTGVGIDEENVKKLFKLNEIFSTAGTAKEKGTGLGLILCKEFVENNGGKIWVESEKGKGSKFIFTLPLGTS